MTTLLISYRISVSPTERQISGLQSAIKAAGPNVRLAEGCYVIDTSDSPAKVYESLKRFVHQNDLMLVMRVSRPYFGQHSQEVVEWLNARL